jgi:SAM-dependent methyltransferase
MDEYAPIADLYHEVPIYAGRPDVGFYVEEATRAGSPVLELGSGTGRILIPTARAGIEIVGLDGSPAMQRVCRDMVARETAEVQSRITLVAGNLASFDLSRTFRLVTIPFRPFQHLVTVAEQLSCLAAIRRHLGPGGRLVLDAFNPSLEALTGPVDGVVHLEAEYGMADGRRVARSFRVVSRDRASQVNQVELIYDVSHPDGRRERLVHAVAMRYFFRYELEHLVARAGFDVEQVYSGFDRSSFGSSYPGELILVARAA